MLPIQVPTPMDSETDVNSSTTHGRTSIIS